MARMREHLGDRQEIKEIPRVQRFFGRPSLGRLFADIQTKTRQQRNQVIEEAHISYGYTLKEIADIPEVHYTTVSKVASSRKKSDFSRPDPDSYDPDSFAPFPNKRSSLRQFHERLLSSLLLPCSSEDCCNISQPKVISDVVRLSWLILPAPVFHLAFVDR